MENLARNIESVHSATGEGPTAAASHIAPIFLPNDLGRIESGFYH
jgi:hypothetical protein